jgi:hypothetical protein
MEDEFRSLTVGRSERVAVRYKGSLQLLPILNGMVVFTLFIGTEVCHWIAILAGSYQRRPLENSLNTKACLPSETILPNCLGKVFDKDPPKTKQKCVYSCYRLFIIPFKKFTSIIHKHSHTGWSESHQPENVRVMSMLIEHNI